mgnify:CR=1 FL=1
METNILMESGTNELEVLEFTVGNNHYGINVAKIKEIVQYSPVTPVPNSHPCVEGIFMPRDLMITVVDLAKVIKAQPSPDITKDMFLSPQRSRGSSMEKGLTHQHQSPSK